jgi:hypothetical protein
MYDSGHHEHDGDAAHAPIQKEWHKQLKYENLILYPVINKIPL